MSALLDLAERCEKAEGPDRELDAEIWCRLNRPHYELPTPIEWRRGWPKTPPNWLRAYSLFNGFVSPPKCTAFTASLDAALTLVPEDSWWRVEREATGDCWARVNGILCQGATPALALCAAALRARAASLPSSDAAPASASQTQGAEAAAGNGEAG